MQPGRVRNPVSYTHLDVYKRQMFGRTLETPIGPAAGPHTQMTQNIVAAYYAGSRFFELKDVYKRQICDFPSSRSCTSSPSRLHAEANEKRVRVELSRNKEIPSPLSNTFVEMLFSLIKRSASASVNTCLLYTSRCV